MPSISIIIPEHKEPKENIHTVLRQIEQLDMPVEVIIVSSSPQLLIERTYPFPVRIITGVIGSGRARNAGARAASSEFLLFMDGHCCFTKDAIEKLLGTLRQYPNAVIVPGIQPLKESSFPHICEPEGGVGYGVFFGFDQGVPFEWRWLGHKKDEPYPVPMGSACFLLMRRKTFFNSVIGFLPVEGVGFDEEIMMRLASLGHPTILQPQSVILHLFKKSYDEQSVKGYVPSRAMGLVLNVFDIGLFTRIDSLCKGHWGESWEKEVKIAFVKFGHLREALKGLRKKGFDERWFFRI